MNELSEEDEPPCAASSSQGQPSARPSKRQRRQKETFEIKECLDDDLQGKLNQKCPCKKDCLKQFKEANLFQCLKDYMFEWQNLAKLDKDLRPHSQRMCLSHGLPNSVCHGGHSESQST